MAELVAGWLAEWLGGRAIGIMEIKAGLSNLFCRLDRQCSRPGRNGTLTRQNTVKTCAAKTLDGLDEKRFTTIASTWIGRLIDRKCDRELLESSEKHDRNRSAASPNSEFLDINKPSIKKSRNFAKIIGIVNQERTSPSPLVDLPQREPS